MNSGAACTTEQCRRGLAHKPAMRWIGPLGNGSDYTFADLDNESNRFANILTALGIGKGDVFFIFVPKSPELFFASPGCLKAQAICAPLFANFGEDALFDRLHDAGAAGIMTTKALYGKIASIRERLPVGRSDDVINTAGHLVSLFEVENVLLELGEVAESGVIWRAR